MWPRWGGTFHAIEPTEAIDSPVKAPPYRELLEFTFGRIGHVRRDFFCYRLRLPMPPLGLMVNLIAGEDPGTVRHQGKSADAPPSPLIRSASRSGHRNRMRGVGQRRSALRQHRHTLDRMIAKQAGRVAHARCAPYPEMGRYLLERLGWHGDRSDVYRCRIEYPVLPSTAVIVFELPEQPTSR